MLLPHPAAIPGLIRLFLPDFELSGNTTDFSFSEKMENNRQIESRRSSGEAEVNSISDSDLAGEYCDGANYSKALLLIPMD
jgi:hypothetical protein